MVLVATACVFSYLYGKWKRDRGLQVTLRDRLWIALVVFAVVFPALVLPSILMTDTSFSASVVYALITIAIGVAPLAVFLLIVGALHCTRRLEDVYRRRRAN